MWRCMPSAAQGSPSSPVPPRPCVQQGFGGGGAGGGGGGGTNRLAFVANLKNGTTIHPAQLDMALWDLQAGTVGVPLYVLFGGLQTRQLPLYHSISFIDSDEMAGIASDETALSITQIQVKQGADANNKADIGRLRLLRAAHQRAHQQRRALLLPN